MENCWFSFSHNNPKGRYMFDRTSDTNNSELYKIRERLDMPEFVKCASLDTKPITELPSASFADPATRTFPINTKAETWLSAAYFAKQASEGSADVRQRLADAVEFWGIENSPLTKESTCFVEKQAAKTETIHFRTDTFEGESVTVSEPDHLLKLASLVTKHPERFPWQMRKQAARQILGVAERMGLEFSEDTEVTLEKTAGYGIGSAKAALQAIAHRRANVAKSFPGFVERLDELSGFVKQASTSKGILAPEFTDKVAGVLDAVDRMSHLSARYNDVFTAPERHLFVHTVNQHNMVKEAALTLPGGQVISAGSLTPDLGVFLSSALGNNYKTAGLSLKEACSQLSREDSRRVYDYVTKCSA